MKRITVLLSLLLMLSVAQVNAMDHWEILFNKKVILKGTSDQEDQTLHFKPRAFKSTDRFTLKYTSEDSEAGWNRTFYLTDTKDENLKTVIIDKQSGELSVKASAVIELMNKKEPVFIYTMSLPKDRKKAAAVRVRRILLCKIEWN